ncbi:Glutathione peroxidase [Trinorchestia longiramus]|nr:Glutathione peroxidase [Trinorchestia longiramus]
MDVVTKFFFIALLFTYVSASDFYSYTIKDNQGEDYPLERLRGKVSLVVNVASLCGFTDTSYKALTKLHDILSYEGYFTVLAFPCNQFGDQEPEEAATVAETMSAEYGVEFPIFNKIDVFGENANPAFRNLVDQSSLEPEWNFYKYLVNHEGVVVNAWGTRTEMEEIFSEIQAAVDAAKESGKEPLKEEPASRTSTATKTEQEAKEEL